MVKYHEMRKRFYDKRFRSFMSRAGFQRKQTTQLKRGTQIYIYPLSCLMRIKTLLAL